MDIGFRFSFKGAKGWEEIKKFLIEYYKYWDIAEIYLTEMLIKKGYIKLIVNLVYSLKKNISIHLDKDVLIFDESFFMNYINKIKELKLNQDTNIIVHYKNLDSTYSKLNLLINKLNNCNILLENENEIDKYYFYNMESLLNLNNKIKICFDIGHWYFTYHNAFPWISLNTFVKKYPVLFSNVLEIHLHDFDGTKDHLPIGDGAINFDFLKEISIFGKECLIYIIEADMLDLAMAKSQTNKLERILINENYSAK